MGRNQVLTLMGRIEIIVFSVVGFALGYVLGRRFRAPHRFNHSFYYHFDCKKIPIADLPQTIKIASSASQAVAKAATDNNAQTSKK